MKREKKAHAPTSSQEVPPIGQQLYTLRRADIRKGSGILFEAFRDDPFFLYAFGESHIDESLVSRLHRFTLRLGLLYGLVQAPTDALEGIAIWLSPGHSAITPWRALRAGIPGFGMQLLQKRLNAGLFIKKMAAFSSYSDQLHSRHAHFPHWYLLSVGIGKKDRGKGYGSQLLVSQLARCDDERLPCYLETHNERNLGLYAHFGFKVMEEGRIPGSETKQWALLRMPQQSG